VDNTIHTLNWQLKAIKIILDINTIGSLLHIISNTFLATGKT